jgi:transcriptional regulator with XRE-family HTH domain
MTTEFTKWDDSEAKASLEGLPQLGLAMQSWRKCQTISQTDLAKRLGISKQLLSRYEKGHQLPSLQKTLELAQLLDAPVALWIQYRLDDEIKALGLDAEITVTFKHAS